MNTPFRTTALATMVIAAALMVAGCAGVTTSHRQEIGGSRFAPSEAGKIEILRTAPTRAHVRLGEVRAEPSGEDVDVALIEAALREEAAKLGVDAVIVASDRIVTTGASVTGGVRNRSVQREQGRVISAIAIKYL